ncbi:MAG: DUF2779 domain-containing protein [Desulfobulbaceae bacterium]
MRLSKSQYIRGLQCPKSLWLYRYRPEVRTLPDAGLLARFRSGADVGELAWELFPGGETIVFDHARIAENIDRTRELILAGARTIYEAAFLHDDVLVMVDILHRGESGWELYEVKSATEVKDVHLDDAAIQHYVVGGSGLDVAAAALVHINNRYVRQGPLDIRSLFTVVPVTDITLAKQNDVKAELERLKGAVAPGAPMPARDIGPHCLDPYECDFKAHCWAHVPEPSVFSLTRMPTARKFELYSRGIVHFGQLPPGLWLTAAQRMQVEAELHGRQFVDRQRIREFLAAIREPAGFLDFETFMQAVPGFDNQRPYQQVPFQYSLHLRRGERLEHYSYLAEAGIDPRLEFTERLLRDTSDCAVILVYNLSFERRILEDLADLFPRHGAGIRSVIERLIDLMTVFRDRSCYLRAMNGSYSIKKVLPALCPEMGYDALSIGDGDMAMNAFAALRGMTDPGEIEQVRADLLAYCGQDTLAMVEIVGRLEQMARG